MKKPQPSAKGFSRAFAIGLAALVCTLAGPSALAQIVPPAVLRQNDTVQRQLEDRLREEQDRARNAVPARPGTELEVEAPRITVPDLGGCRDIQRIAIDGATQLPATLRQQIDTDYAGQCLDSKKLENILALITKSYIDQGLITSRAYLPAQDLRTGTLTIRVVEGRIEKYELDATRPGGVSLSGAFPAALGDLLNLRDLEQGTDQLNRLASNSATLDIRPGQQPGESIVVVRNPSRSPARLFLSADNLGTPATGRDSLTGTLSLGSLLGLNELIAITQRNSVPHDADHRSKATALLFSVPWGYWNFGADLSRTSYGNRITQASGNTLLAEGRTDTIGLTVDRVLFRNAGSRLNASARIGTQDTTSYVGGELLGVASRKLAISDVSVSGFVALGGGVLNGRLAWAHGLKGLGALHDPADLARDQPHAQFDKLNVELGFDRRFKLAETTFAWSSQFSAQKAFDTLYGSQQFLIGGPGSVRGSLVNTLSGDNGLLWRNELALPFSQQVGGVPVVGRGYIGLDAGRVSNRAAGVPSGSMSGATVGVSVQAAGASVDLFVSRAIRLPTGMRRESTQVGLRLSYSL
ncbi:ShlB/FhaC/HecB family hemolysin secretion/activation protein [Variovorax sp. IB41]|uniref:ShlB/FhaC/HecB family hemolysin secretion/activation protein n=1 Tax=Variovorax sp. IB41 TaxID=2779370 RepID=UPI0018E7E847|nr:ShlB/FhaC/HecB family hemolysin secretion/activation protein [Variovorax sp. IB41]MBJ2154883.1 ShlB/FhaC/HecB family hemolysin secretion/activation protein [Variovorax sp. IB41]